MEVKFWPRYWNSQTKRTEVSNRVFPLFILTTDPCTSSIQYIFVRDHELFHKRDFRLYHYAVSTVKHTTRNPSPMTKMFCCRWTILNLNTRLTFVNFIMLSQLPGSGFLSWLRCFTKFWIRIHFYKRNSSQLWYHQWDLVQPCFFSSTVCNAVYLLKCNWIDISQTSL